MFPFFSFRFIQLVWRSFFSLPQNPAHPYNVTLMSNVKKFLLFFPGCIPCLTLKPLCPRSIYYVLCFPRGNPTNRVISTPSFFIIDLPTNNQENREWLEPWILAGEPIWVRSAIVLLVTWRRPPLQPIQEPPLVSHILPRGFPTHSCTKSLYLSITHIIGHKLKFLFHTTTKNSRQTSVASEHNHSVLDRSTGTKEQTIPLYSSFRVGVGGWCGEVGTWWLSAKSARHHPRHRTKVKEGGHGNNFEAQFLFDRRSRWPATRWASSSRWAGWARWASQARAGTS